MGVPDGTLEALIAQLTHDDGEMRTRAATALGRTEDPRAVEPLIEALGDKEFAWIGNRQREVGARLAAAEALGRIGDPRAVEPLISMLGGYAESEAAKALGRIGDPRAVGPLCGFLERQGTFRGEVAEALREIGDIRAIVPLIKALRDEDEMSNGEVGAAVDFLTRKPESNISLLPESDLEYIAALPPEYPYVIDHGWIDGEACRGTDYEDAQADFVLVKQLARQELVRRKGG